MMQAAWFILFFTICNPLVDTDDACEDGHIIARSCVVAEMHLRNGLRPGIIVHLGECTRYQM
jgi:hypothetical protein